MEDFCKMIPKVELHAHINGSISESTMADILKLKKDNVDPDWRLMFKKGETGSLQDTFKMFKLIHQVSNSEAAAYKITYDVIHEFATENVKYLELRTTPREEASTGMTRESYIKAVLQAIDDCRLENLDIIVRLLLAIDRQRAVETALNTVDLAIKYRELSKGTVLGIDLSGNPYVGNAATFIPALKKAKNNGLKLALHLAEIPAPEETNELLQLIPDRIGHGTCLQPETGGTQGLVDTVIKHRIPLESDWFLKKYGAIYRTLMHISLKPELCLTSNIVNEVVPDYDSHHFKFWYQLEHPCVICTDDKGVFSTSLSEEYCKAAATFDLSRQHIWDVSYDSINHIFADEDTKQTLRNKWKSYEILLNK